MSCVVGECVPLCGTAMLPRSEHVPGNEAQWGFQKEKTKKAKTISAFWRTQDWLPLPFPLLHGIKLWRCPTFPRTHLPYLTPVSLFSSLKAHGRGSEGGVWPRALPRDALSMAYSPGAKGVGGNDLCHLIKSRCVFCYLLISYCFNSPSYRLFSNTMSSLTSHSDSRLNVSWSITLMASSHFKSLCFEVNVPSFSSI